jgi:hypothetical protein
MNLPIEDESADMNLPIEDESDDLNLQENNNNVVKNNKRENNGIKNDEYYKKIYCNKCGHLNYINNDERKRFYQPVKYKNKYIDKDWKRKQNSDERKTKIQGEW